jgi:dihydrofolate reductase
MGKIVVSDNITLDGVVQDPTGEEGFRFGGWFNEMSDKDRQDWAKVEFEEALGADALLLGGRSYRYFATGWASRPGAWADRLRSLPKYVVSSTLDNAEWSNTTVLNGDVVDEVSTLKRELSREIVVYASFQLVHTLWEHDLIDELRLTVHPFVLGAGERLFREASHRKPVRLVDNRTLGEGIAFLTYAVVRAEGR